MSIKITEETKNVLIGIAVATICVAIITPIAIFGYKHRVVETKSYDVMATITDKIYEPPYTTTTKHKDSNGNTHTQTHHHPAKYKFEYTVIFEGGTYAGNKDEVTKDRYNSYKVGDQIPATYIKEWRADETETYKIKLK
jgi:Tfp pilus assembly protein PilE